ncbi:MAG: phosphoribosylglycinamide formyltransferase [Firmicutes bacterium]|nr:phosphoribosylglycinamide formyltransferase [Bacillota bacterium]
MKKIAVLVSGGGTNLQAILDAEKSGIIKSAKVVTVISDSEGAFALTRAENAGVEAVCIPKKSADFEARLIGLLDEKNVDLIVLAGFLSILSSEFTRHFEGKIINIHPSLIPSFCGKGFYGLRVHQAALARGVKLTGATVHYVNEIPDGGRIIAQKAVKVLPGDTPEALQQRVMKEAEHVILPQAIEDICSVDTAESEGR